MDKITWIVIANASSAKIYTKLKGDHQLSLIKEFEHPDSRKKASELMSDGVGRYKARDSATGTYSPRTEPKLVEAEHFAKQLADVLEHARKTNDFKSLILVAPSHFQALIKNHISDQLSSQIQETISKDYHDASLKELQDLFT